MNCCWIGLLGGLLAVLCFCPLAGGPVEAGQARVTIFEGGHEQSPEAAIEWLSKQARR